MIIMMCEQCGKNHATTHIHTVVNGVSKTMDLCGYCAAAGGYMSPGGGNLVHMLQAMFGESVLTKPTAFQKRCSCCGASFSDIASTGKAGCANCYKEFEAEFMPSLERLHGNTRHIGKVPGNVSGNIKTAARLQGLKTELSRAIELQEFEKAAKIRDEIKELEEGEEQ